MKKNILLLFAFCALITTFSCNSDATETGAEENSIQTRALPKTAEAESEASSFALITRKWEFGEEYIDLDIEGSFEAVLEGKHIKGRWGLTNGTEDNQTLKLIGKEDGAESKANSFNRTYELIAVSYDRLVAVDAEGNKINFFPEK